MKIHEILFLKNQGRDFAFDVSDPRSNDEYQLRSDLIKAKKKFHDEDQIWNYLINYSKSWKHQFQSNPSQTYNWFQNWFINFNWKMPE